MDCVIGISQGFHDSAACVVGIDGKVLFASSEERYTRIKGDKSWPKNCLSEIHDYISSSSLNVASVCYYEKYDQRLFWQILNSIKSFILFKIGLRKFIREVISSFRDCIALHYSLKDLLGIYSLAYRDLYLSDHHISHLMASYAYSSSSSGIFCVLDAFGQNKSGIVGEIDSDFGVRVEKNLFVNKSVGLFYSCLTRLCGFKVLTGEYKLMGLAPYGQPKYFNQLCEVFGSPNLSDFDTAVIDIGSSDIVSSDIEKRLGVSKRLPESEISQEYMDWAASAQLYLEYLVTDIVRKMLEKKYPSSDYTLFLGGGVALNCKLNYELRKSFPDLSIAICPAAGDSGSCIGAAYAHLMQSTKFSLYPNSNVCIGSELNAYDIDRYLNFNNIRFVELSNLEECSDVIASLLADGKIGALFQGNAEFGPRALGNRSILADPSSESALSIINSLIKAREDFRPLAPVTTDNLFKTCFDASQYTDLFDYMLSLIRVDENLRSSIYSAVHVDNTARLQVVKHDSNPLLFNILQSFYNQTSIPALINTSFNQRGEPIVNSARDALITFASSELDFLLLERRLIRRSDQSLSAMRVFERKIVPALD